jgi:uncharacterized protein (DUF1015 family)
MHDTRADQMADIRAFRGYRYDLGRVGALGDVVAPPYDVIGPQLRDALEARSPHNVVRLILERETPADTDANNRYTRSAGTLRDWLREDVLVQDSARSLYVYEQEFEVEGRRLTRKGFMARVRLEPFGTGRVFPHEATLAAPKADRLKLLRATNMNLSPLFGLYPDSASEVSAALEAGVRRGLPLEATDPFGVVHRIWPLSDQHTISAVSGLISPQPIFIADGHHRYETALRYLQDRREAGEILDDESAPNFVLMHLVGMSDPGLVILPTHRLVHGFDGLRADRLAEILAPHFDLERMGGAQDTWETIQMDGGQSVLGFGTRADGVWQLARLRDKSAMARVAPTHSATWQDLGVSVLHALVLDHLLDPALGAEPRCDYVHQLQEVQECAAPLAVLVPPATMEHVAEIAANGETMPAKSTYFYPKLLSGLVFNPLRMT